MARIQGRPGGRPFTASELFPLAPGTLRVGNFLTSTGRMAMASPHQCQVYATSTTGPAQSRLIEQTLPVTAVDKSIRLGGFRVAIAARHNGLHAASTSCPAPPKLIRCARWLGQGAARALGDLLATIYHRSGLMFQGAMDIGLTIGNDPFQTMVIEVGFTTKTQYNGGIIWAPTQRTSKRACA
jgi:hypothetical protein